MNLTSKHNCVLFRFLQDFHAFLSCSVDDITWRVFSQGSNSGDLGVGRGTRKNTHLPKLLSFELGTPRPLHIYVLYEG